MNKLHNIFYMVIGVGGVIVGVLKGGRLTVLGLIGAAILLFFGARSIFQIRRERAGRKSKRLKDPAVAAFYRRTQKAWAEGRLDEIAPLRRKEAAKGVDRLVRRYAPYKTSALEAMFLEFPPEEDEYLVHEANAEETNGRGWFVLTNKRLVMKDGSSGDYRAVRFSDIASFESKGRMSREFVFRLKDGRAVGFSKVEIFPRDEWIEKLRSGWPDRKVRPSD